MLEESLARNFIVATDTGSGETHIAIVRIQAELERSGAEKIIWFMTPNKALSEQLCAVLQEHLPAYHIKSLTGADNVDKWTDQRLWDAFLNGSQVVVGMPPCLADALTHGLVKIGRLSLLVFDEAHRCTGNHPMNQTMRGFYYTTKQIGNPVPHILDLSASPVMSAQANRLNQIETNLDATTVTPKLNRNDLAAHVHTPGMLRIGFPQTESPVKSPSLLSLRFYQAVF